MIALPPIRLDRTTGVLEGANARERFAALDRVKVSSNVGYAFGTASAFRESRINVLNAHAARRVQ